MAKLLKISGRTLGIILEWLLISIIAFAFAIRTSPVQTFLAQKAASYLSKELNTTVKIDRVSIIFFDEVALDGVLILDEAKDTLLSVETLFATLDEMRLSDNYFKIGKVRLDDGYVHLKKDTTGRLNLAFIQEYFASTKKKEKKNIEFAITTVSLNDTRFIYDDAKHPNKTFGFDHFHIDAKDINGVIDKISIVNKDIKATITELTASEKSGLELESLTANAEMSGSGVLLSDLNLKTSKSKIVSPKFNLLTNHYSDFYKFVDSVTFDVKINDSRISMEDVALFGTSLEGMNEIIRFRTDISKTINNLKLSNLDLRIRKKTHLKGTFNVPDFNNLKSTFIHETLDYAYVDITELKQIKLPKSSSQDYLTMDVRVDRLSYFEAMKVSITGFYSQFVLDSDYMRTALGGVRMDNGIRFTQNERNNSFFFSKSTGNDRGLKVEHFQLGKFLNNGVVGEVDGTFLLAGEAFSPSKIIFNEISGDVNRFDLMDYSYSNISIANGTFKNNVFKSDININDPNLKLKYVGVIDLNGDQKMTFTTAIEKAILNKLGFVSTESSLTTEVDVNITGNNLDSYAGTVVVDGFSYLENGKEIAVPKLELRMDRGELKDDFQLKSNIAEVLVSGKVDFTHLWTDVKQQINRVFPVLYAADVHDDRGHEKDSFTFNMKINEANKFLAIFAPDLSITSGSKLNGHYYGETSEFKAKFTSDTVVYKKMTFTDLQLDQDMSIENINATYHVDHFSYNDSLHFDDLYFKSFGGNNELTSEFTWDQETPDASSIEWLTEVEDIDRFNFMLKPSYFSIKGRRWEIANESRFQIDRDTVRVSEFLLKRDKQELKLDGQISRNDKDKLKFDVKRLQLEEISDFITQTFKMKGELNAFGYISNPYENFKHTGTAHLMQFFIDAQEIGDIMVNSEWDNPTKSINLTGDLMYKGLRSFDFVGDYFVEREEENLAFSLTFDQTNIEFTNAFMDPDVIGDIKGFLNGKVQVSGTAAKPELEGKVSLNGGSARVELLGAHFGFEGPILVDSDGFYINGIPVFDEDGNAGSLIGSVYHTNFSDFNFDLLFNLEDDAINRDPIEPWRSVPLERFLVMNSVNKPGDLYYGKAYTTGTANIFGYTNNLEITVDLETKKGTKINFPMYGAGEIAEEYDFIEFIDHSLDANAPKEPKINFSGVKLDMKFNVTDDADLKIIFNEELGDIITAKGSGEIAVVLDNIGDIRMDGTFTMKEGVYDFAMGPIKKKFFIEKGGTIGWTGSPYNANLDLKTYLSVHTNIAALSADKFGSGSSAREEIYCYLNLKETLLKPAIDFDITAPKANETSKSLLNRVRSEQDELNRQFFSLLLWKKFQPLAGESQAGGSAAVDLITNQINSLLSKISSDYQMNINVDNDELTGDNSFEFGVQKGFLDDRLLLSGSFGVESGGTKGSDDGAIIGDLNLEYLLNESGTFRINIFNESNDKSIIQNQQQGHFTQGAGLYYQEDFNTVEDFKAFQYFLNIFRKEENKRYKDKRKKRRSLVPKKEEDPAIETDDSQPES